MTFKDYVQELREDYENLNNPPRKNEEKINFPNVLETYYYCQDECWGTLQINRN